MPANDYTVTNVQEVTILDEGGAPVTGYRIWFAWADGRKGKVDMRKDRATRELRDSLILAEIARQEDLWA